LGEVAGRNAQINAWVGILSNTGICEVENHDHSQKFIYLILASFNQTLDNVRFEV
jgi:hypothetical protein